MPTPSFRPTNNGILLPHVKAAFLRDLYFLASLPKPASITANDGRIYQVTYDGVAADYVGNAIASFQQWIDGSNHCIIRPRKQPTSAT